MHEPLSLKTRQQIADELGIDRKTLYNKLKNAGITLNSGLLSPEAQLLIYKLFGKQREDPAENRRA